MKSFLERNGWISRLKRLPVPKTNDDGTVNSVLLLHTDYDECVVPYSVSNATYARLHPEEYSFWKYIEDLT